MRVRLALSALVVLLAAAVTWLGVRTASQSREIARLENELQAARAARAAAPRPAQQPPAAAPAPVERREPSRTDRPLAAINSEIEELKARLRQATADIASTQARLHDVQVQLQDATAERSRAVAAEADARTRVGDLNQKLDGVTAELATAQKRIREVETENGNLRQRYAGVSQSNDQLRRLATELQEITRRQQSYLSNVVMRYREVRDLFRRPTIADERTGGSGPDVARIESTISMADEDLRALRELNVRLGAMQKQIASAAKP